MSDKLESIRDGYYSIGVFEGVERFIRFDLNAFAELERIYGSMETANEALNKGSMTDVRRILWLGLIHDQAILDEITGEPIKYKLTMYEVGKWLTPNNMREVMTRLNKAITGAIPDDEATEIIPEPAQALAEGSEKPELTLVTNPN